MIENEGEKLIIDHDEGKLLIRITDWGGRAEIHLSPKQVELLIKMLNRV